MAEVVEELQIARPTGVVWAVLADFGGISRWAPNVDHSCLTTDSGSGVGAVRRVQVGRNALLESVVAWEPHSQLTYVIDGLPPVVRTVANSWVLVGAGDTTTVRLTSSVDAGPRPPQQVAARVFGRVLAKASQQMLGGLKTHLEETSP